ncbi:MAG: DUF6428 family protein [Pseudomonadota bacterium]
MKEVPMTPQSLLDDLKILPPDLPVVFRTEAGEIAQGYHVTELKHARVTSIDCAARLSEWSQASLQLLDGDWHAQAIVDPAMSARKLSGILSQSIARLDGVGAAELQVEFAHGNAGMRIYRPQRPLVAGSSIVIELADNRAQCKPASGPGCGARCQLETGATACCA